MTPTLNLTTKRGDTFQAVNFQIKRDGIAVNLTGANVKMQLRKEAGGLVYYEAELTIYEPLNGRFRIDEQIINIQECTYKYDIEIVETSGFKSSYVNGNFTIFEDITR